MNQYGVKFTNYPVIRMSMSVVHKTVTLEALLGSPYGAATRRTRRSLSAVEWLLMQVSTKGLPQQYHCGGV